MVVCVSLPQVVVDSDATAKKIVSNGGLTKRVTIIPLNQVRPPFPLIHRLAVMQQHRLCSQPSCPEPTLDKPAAHHLAAFCPQSFRLCKHPALHAHSLAISHL